MSRKNRANKRRRRRNRKPLEISLETATLPSGEIGLTTSIGQHVDVDVNAGTIKNVAVLTLGPAAGWGFEVDQTMMEEVRDAMLSNGTTKCRWRHPDGDGTGSLIGHFSNPRIVGTQLRADLQLGSFSVQLPTGERVRDYLLGVASEMPQHIGTSIAASLRGYEHVRSDGGEIRCARIQQLKAIDIVDQPAANPQGLLQERKDIAVNPFIELINNLMAAGGMSQDQAVAALAERLGADASTASSIVTGQVPPTDEQITAMAEVLNADADQLRAAAKQAAPGANPESPADSSTPQERQLAQNQPAAQPTGQPAAALSQPAQPRYTGQPANQPAQQPGQLVPISQALQMARQQSHQDVQLAERNRISSIISLAEQHDLPQTWADLHINGGSSIESVNSAALAVLATRRSSNQPGAPARVTGGDNLAHDGLAIALGDALTLRANGGRCRFYEEDGPAFSRLIRLSDTGEPVTRSAHQRTREFSVLTPSEMCRRYIELAGGDTAGLSKPQVCRAVFNERTLLQLGVSEIFLASSSNFSAILEDTINKSLRREYIEVAQSWQMFCRRVTNPDFKQISRTKLHSVATPTRVFEAEEYGAVQIGDSKEVYALAKYGHLFLITWESFVNDDLDAFSRIPRMHVRAAARLEDKLAYAQLTGNPTMTDGNALFSVAAANLANPGAPLEFDTLSAGRAAMKKQRGDAEDGEQRLDLRAKTLIVSPDYQTKAEELVESPVKPDGGSAANTKNVFQGKLDLLSTDYLTGAEWFLTADPSDIDTIEMCFLEGEETPFLEQQEHHTADGRSYKLRHVVAAKAIDRRGLYSNPGS